MASSESSPTSRALERTAAVLFVVVYAAAVVAVAILAQPVTPGMLVAVAMLPAAVAFLFGIPKVWRSKPRGLPAVFHLVVYPLLAAIMLGLPAVLITWRVAEFFEG